MMNENIVKARKYLYRETDSVLDDIEKDIQKIKNIPFGNLITGNSYKDDRQFILKNMKRKIEYLSEISNSIQNSFNFTSYE